VQCARTATSSEGYVYISKRACVIIFTNILIFFNMQGNTRYVYCKKNAKHKQRQGYHTFANQNHQLYNGICLCNVGNTLQSMQLSSIAASNSASGGSFANNSFFSNGLDIITNFAISFSEKNNTHRDNNNNNDNNSSLVEDSKANYTRVISSQAISLSSLLGFTSCVR